MPRRSGRGFNFSEEEKKSFLAKKRAAFLDPEEDPQQNSENSEHSETSEEGDEGREIIGQNSSSIVPWNSLKIPVQEKEPSKNGQGIPNSEIMNHVKQYVSGLELKNQRVQHEVEMNDYPQCVRWKILNKETLQHVTELSGASLSVKGIFCPPNRRHVSPERKLYLLIEGVHHHDVDVAKKEIHRILAEAIEKSRNMGVFPIKKNNFSKI